MSTTYTVSGGTTNGDILPAATGQNLGSAGQRWNAYIQTLSLSGALTSGSLNSFVVVDGTTYAKSMAGISSAVAALGTSPGAVILSPGAYTDDGTTTVTISHDRQHIIGSGWHSCQITASTSRSVPMFKLYTGSATLLNQCAIGGFALLGNGSSAAQRVGLQITNNAEVFVHDIAVFGWYGATSIGIDIQGLGSHCVFSRLNVQADRPIYIETNPQAVAGYDFDTVHFEDLLLDVNVSTEGGIVFGQGVTCTHWTVDGVNTVTRGANAIQWRETTAAATVSDQVYISNLHHEQSTGLTSNYSFDFSRSGSAQALQDLVIVNCCADPLLNGFKIQKTAKALFLQPKHLQAGGTAFNADNTNSDVVILNPNFASGSTYTNSASSSAVQQYITNGGAIRTGIAGSAFYFDVGGLIVRNGDSTNPGYLQTTTTNPATAGAYRLAKTETVDWRNNGNSADLPLGIDSGDRLTFNSLQIPLLVASVDLTAQAAAVATTTLFAVVTAGQYQLRWNAKVTTADGVSSTLGALTIAYTDPDGVAQTITAPASVAAGTVATTSTGNTTATVLLGLPLTLNCKAATNITYAMAYTSNTPGSMKYNLHLKLVQI